MKNTITLFVLLINLTLVIKITNGQATSCSTADPVCLNNTNTYHMNINTSAESGPNYGCLWSYSNPAWYYIKILNPGSLNIRIQGNDGSIGRDIDFICWGPFNSLNNVCTDSLIGACFWVGGSGTPRCPNNTTNPTFYPTQSAPNIIDCSYDANPTENCRIPNAQTGKYYMLCITNYSNQPGNITFTQTSGTGSSDCTFLQVKEKLTNINSFAVYPNPNSGKFTISFNSDLQTSFKLEIINSLGQKVFLETINNLVDTYSKEINLLEYGKGIYTISLSNNNQVAFKKVIVY